MKIPGRHKACPYKDRNHRRRQNHRRNPHVSGEDRRHGHHWNTPVYPENIRTDVGAPLVGALVREIPATPDMPGITGGPGKTNHPGHPSITGEPGNAGQAQGLPLQRQKPPPKTEPSPESPCIRGRPKTWAPLEHTRVSGKHPDRCRGTPCGCPGTGNTCHPGYAGHHRRTGKNRSPRTSEHHRGTGKYRAGTRPAPTTAWAPPRRR